MSNAPSSAAASAKDVPSWYQESRKKAPSQDGAITFTILRALELPWQYYLLTGGLGTSLIHRLGLRLQPIGATETTFGLPIHPYHALILGLSAGTSLSQIFWVWAVRDNYFPPAGAAAIAGYNTLLNTINSVLALWYVTSQAPGPTPRDLEWGTLCFVGVPLYLLGTYLERYSEVQRKAFKAKAENKGKPFAGGLFGLARNVNYTGYTLMRAGYAMVCGGWVWAAVLGGVVFADFAFRAVPWLEKYCEERYGQQWREVKRKVPARLVPGIF